MYASDLDPKGMALRRAVLDRKKKLREEIENVPLGAFHVGDLEPLLRLMGLAGPDKDCQESDMTQLEERVREYRAWSEKEFYRHLRDLPFGFVKK